MKSLVTSARIENKIHIIRNHSVMLDSDLAQLYGVETKFLKRNVNRNIERFPLDFMFELTPKEQEFLRCQIGTLEKGRGKHPKYLPYVFTQEGVAMLSSVLNSKRAIQVNIQIMRAFIRLKGFQFSVAGLRKEIQEMRRKYDAGFASVFDAIGKLLDRPKKLIKVKGFSGSRED